MNKYDTMIACNRKTSEEKVNRAVTEIRQMLTDREKVNCTKVSKADRVIQRILLQERNRQERNGSSIGAAGWID